MDHHRTAPAHPGRTRPGGVLVVGSITADVTTFSDRLPARGETVLGDDLTLVLGGKGANQALASALAGADTVMAGCVGSDLFQELTLGSMTAHGIDTSRVRVVDGPTGVAHIRVDASGENDIVMVPLANDHLSLQDVDDAVTATSGRASVLLTQLEIPREIAAHAITRGHEAGMTVVLDPAPAAVLPAHLWPAVDVVTPNETEARVITGIDVHDADSAIEAGRWFVERGAANAVITLAAAGAVLVDRASSVHVAAAPVDAVDTTAAGDAFAGYLGADLARGLDVASALQRAMAAGALAVTRRGASPSLPAATEVEQLLTTRQGREADA
ncbi:MAG: ribokinase [Nocardioidaceae bacterium]